LASLTVLAGNLPDPAPLNLNPYFDDLQSADLLHWVGIVREMVGLLIESDGPSVAIGDFCEVQTAIGGRIRCQVVGFRDGRVLSLPLDEPTGIQLGSRVVARKQAGLIGVGPELLGRILDGFGKPMDEGEPVFSEAFYELAARAPSPLSRANIDTPLTTGFRVIDGMLPLGVGQRVGLFGGSGVGKSTLLSALCRNQSADVNVIALIGERNREVRQFIENDLGPEGMRRSVVVVATSDQPAPLRVRAAFVAMAIAEYFRDKSQNVLLVMDSVTRLAMAQREIGLSSGEPPSQKGYTPSVFSLLPRIFERAGKFETGSITGIYTVLVEGDDFNEPVCDAVRGTIDGHIILSRRLQAEGHYPCIDVLSSISRLAGALMDQSHAKNAQKLREALATYHGAEDLIDLGAHVEGRNAKLDASIRCREPLKKFLRQSAHETATREETRREMEILAQQLP
jgi:FliI/YscN family ATPase